MNKIKLALAAALLTTGIAQASTSCNGFEIKVKNTLADDLLVRKIHLEGGSIQPSGIEKINKHTGETFTIGNVSEDAILKGELILNTITLPTKEVRIQFDLENKGLICEHTDHSSSAELSVSKTRLPGKVQYTVGN